MKKIHFKMDDKIVINGNFFIVTKIFNDGFETVSTLDGCKEGFYFTSFTDIKNQVKVYKPF